MICMAAFKDDFNEALLEHIDRAIYLDEYVEKFLYEKNLVN